jgi:hypothetical protein
MTMKQTKASVTIAGVPSLFACSAKSASGMQTGAAGTTGTAGTTGAAGRTGTAGTTGSAGTGTPGAADESVLQRGKCPSRDGNCTGIRQWTTPIAIKGHIVLGGDGCLCSWSPQ